jgi:hypothetical protein
MRVRALTLYCTMTGGRMILLPKIYFCFRQASYIIEFYHYNLTLLQLVLPPPRKRKERVWEHIQVPEWRDGGAVGGDPSRLVDGKRQRKDVNYRDK